MNAPTLFRARFPFVCDRCDFGYRAGRLCGHNADGRLECAKCLVGADPDDDTTPTSQETPPCSQPASPPAPTLFDN